MRVYTSSKNCNIKELAICDKPNKTNSQQLVNTGQVKTSLAKLTK